MKKATLKSAFAGAATAAMTFAATSASAEDLRIYNWAEYIGETTIEDFAKETGYNVVYDTYDSVETVDAKLLAGKTGYDVVDHSSSTSAKLVKAGILHEIDKSKLSNYGNIRTDILKLMEKWDPGNKYMVPYTWGTNGVTFVPSEVEKVLPNAPLNFDMIFKPENMEKLAQCGVSFLDSPEDVIPMALGYLGLDPNSTNKKDYKKAGELLASVRPYIKTFDNYAYTRLAEKEFCVMVTWGPDGLLAQDAANEAGLDLKVDFFTHPGASALWVDSWMIPSDAGNVDGAHKFIDYMNRPQVAADASNAVWYANTNHAADELVDEVVRSSKAAYPPAEEVATMYTGETLPQKVNRVRTRTWTNFKSAN
ncbi:extracellular solute-binding protein [Curvivirga sp.]|uniref:extracellular solute-binding protein n=1 Tax=Curvivirga sp. TaxID=2856848 RepID=UPI003B59B3A6